MLTFNRSQSGSKSGLHAWSGIVVATGIAVVAATYTSHAAELRANSQPLALRQGWSLESGCKTQAHGETVSSSGFDTKGWYEVTVPSTVLAAQVAAGEIKDPYYSDNLRKIPGTTYPVGENFSNLPMDANSPTTTAVGGIGKSLSFLRRRKAVRSGCDLAESTIGLISGSMAGRIADSTQVAGAYRTYEFDITAAALPGKANVVAVETFAPTETDLGH